MAVKKYNLPLLINHFFHNKSMIINWGRKSQNPARIANKFYRQKCCCQCLDWVNKYVPNHSICLLVFFKAKKQSKAWKNYYGKAFWNTTQNPYSVRWISTGWDSNNCQISSGRYIGFASRKNIRNVELDWMEESKRVRIRERGMKLYTKQIWCTYRWEHASWGVD